MQIRELYLKNFGKFSDRTFLIKDGINLFYGENEFGKSTLFAFIKGMLFGMERARGRASKNDVFSQYEPWENPNYYAGVLKFTSGGRNFRIERSFDKITKSASLICEDDGEELSLEQGDLDVLLDGMTMSSFENTIAIGQLGVETNQDLAAQLKNFAANYYESKDGDIDVSHALQLLKEKRHEVDLMIRQETLKNEHKRSRIEQECEYVRRDIEKLKIDEHYAKISKDEPEEEVYEEIEDVDETGSWTEEDFAPMRRRRRKFIPALCIFLVLIVTEVILLVLASKSGMDHIVKVVAIIVDVLLAASMAAIYLAKIRLMKEDKEAASIAYEQDDEQGDERDDERDHTRGGDRQKNNLQVRRGQRSGKERKQWEMNRIRANLHEKQVRLSNLNERLEELEIAGYELTQNDQRRQAIQLAGETITKLSTEIVKGFGHALNEKASEIISAITDGKYEKLYLNENMDMFLLTKEKRVPATRLSRGTIEQIYFALRMAAIEVLYEEDFPVILDDTFVFYDEARLESVLKWLSTQKRQVILFTCQKREYEILNRLEIPYGINE